MLAGALGFPDLRMFVGRVHAAFDIGKKGSDCATGESRQIKSDLTVMYR
jgi:hypothetical protein